MSPNPDAATELNPNQVGIIMLSTSSNTSKHQVAARSENLIVPGTNKLLRLLFTCTEAGHAQGRPAKSVDEPRPHLEIQPSNMIYSIKCCVHSFRKLTC